MLAGLVGFDLLAVLFFSFLPFIAILTLVASAVMLLGFFSLQPNEARVLVLFGTYKGTVRSSGFHWGNPFYARIRSTGGISIDSETHQPRFNQVGYKVSLRARSLDVTSIKVNDRQGNPIEIGAVVVWRVVDSAKALFDVDNYTEFVKSQSETALRYLSSQYAYDHGEKEEITLRNNIEQVSAALCAELRTRLQQAGIEIDQARLTHLAYAPEIAHAMLRRQQADAVIAARERIVHGAVSMVEMALTELKQKRVVTFDEVGKAKLVSNLMVVLCSESEVQPVLSTGE